jgi:glutamine amidotransferase
MLEFKKQKLVLVLKEHIQNKKLFLGICLGMQLLFDESQESKLSTPGLGIIKGNVKRFNKKNIKVPHIGWNQLKNINDKCPLLQDIQDGAYVYFCHSFYPDPEDKSSIASTCDYGIDFTSVIWKDNVYGMQFHPEKSQSVGLKMLKNFVEL